MEPAAINSFLDLFLSIADQGFSLIGADVRFVLNALIVISIALAGVQWTLGQEAPLAPFFRKVLFVGFFAFLINNWDSLSSAVNETGAALGLKAGGASLSLADLSNPGRIAAIGADLFGRTAALGQGMNIVTDFVALSTIYIAALLVMGGFFVLALQLFIALIAFKLGSLAAFIALPWGVFSGTAWVAERPLGWVAGSAVKLFMLAFVASVSVAFVDTLPQFTLDAGGVLNVLLFGLTMIALSWFAPALASEVVQGAPHLASGDVVRSVQGAALTGAGSVIGARASASVPVGLAKGAVALARRARGGARANPVNYSAMRPRPSGPPKPPSEGSSQ